MKKLLTILFIFCFKSSFSQTVVNRAGAANTVSDSRLQAKLNFYVPRYTDTTSANAQIGIDSCGALIFTYNIDNYWIRRCTPSKHWEQLSTGGSAVILPQCGIANGTGIVTWDSLLVFDITASLYALCCDNVARRTRDTVIVLPVSDPTNPRIDAIVLTRNGIKIDTGVAAANPAVPQLDSCQLLLTYVLINAGQTQPAFVTPTNPLIIYDENFTGEWPIDSIRNVSLDTTNTDFPVHLLKDIKVSSFPTTDNTIIFTSPVTIDLNNYAVLKYYAKRIAFTAGLQLTFTWYLDNAQQTLPATFTIVPSSGYQIFVIPIPTFRIIGTTKVNKLRVNIGGNNQVFYLDWIQLQSGTVISNQVVGSGTVTSVGSGNLPPLFNTTVSSSNTTPVINFTQQSSAAYTAFGNFTNLSAPATFGKIDLGTPIVTGFLSNLNIAAGPNGSFKQTIGGVVSDVSIPNDTTFVKPPLVRTKNNVNNNDTLSIHLIAGTGITLDSTSNGTKISASGGVPNLQQVTDVGNTTTNTILASNYIETQSNAGLDFNIDESGKLIATGYGGVIHFNQATGEMIFQSSFSSGSAGTFPSFTSPNIAIEPAGNVRLYNYGLGTFTGTPTKALQVDVNGNIIEGIPIAFPNGSWKITPITATAASAIATAEGLIVFVSSTNGTFTSIGLWSFQNGAWHAL